jgi:hypothetical protein
MDEVFKSRLVYQDHEDKLYHEVTQPTENLILERNKELRNNPGVLRDLGEGDNTFGRQVASIPLVMYEKAIRDGYDLNNRDAQIATREMMRYLQSPEGQICLV